MQGYWLENVLWRLKGTMQGTEFKEFEKIKTQKTEIANYKLKPQ